ncbi:MAG: class A beta-lactamase [Bacteroidota bacterium]
MKKILVLALFAIAIHATAQKKKAAPEPDRNAIIEQRLKAEVDRLALTGGGKLGVTAIHVETGKRFSRFGGDPFPMASTYKVPIAVQLLTRVDSGKLSLDQMIEFSAKDMHIGSGMISDRFNWPGAGKPGVALSVRSLLELMLLISDNSATDKCLELAGGGAMVNACMKRWGVEGIRVDRPTSWLIADWLGIPWPEASATPRADFEAVEKVTPAEQIVAAAKKFEDDPRDTSTPDGMADLLLKIHTRPALSASSQALLLDIMDRCETGQARIKGLLPVGTQVRHKTGTIGAATNDVGIITLPGDAGHIVIAAFVRSSEKEIPARENAIAQVARVLHDHFLLNR